MKIDDETYNSIMKSLEKHWEDHEVSYYVKPRESMWRSCSESRRSVCVYVDTNDVWEVYRECDFCLWLRRGNVEIQERRTVFNQYWDPVQKNNEEETVVELRHGCRMVFDDKGIIFIDADNKKTVLVNYEE